ncbi:3',5'-cyclic-nucleotide phosphodiesterase [Pelistega indica]|uniref:3',5'-cyclic-nucleotide phosphodiesterase n=1 Tax=Pelistega indica TaxID=1414851 RepID=V8G0I2_9BURK|nr:MULTISPECIES: phosphodiesterase [Pelistega]ETD69207.1 3',5'-cyclic-nucleotide phosphodiesterase [Pelistega indica]
MLLAHISDLHFRPQGQKLYDFIDVNQKNANVIAHLNALEEQPDAIVITGDIVNCGMQEEYIVAKRILGFLNAPVYIVPGNHDHKEYFLEAFKDICPLLGDDPSKMHYSVDFPQARLYFIDSVVPGASYGELSAETLQWLDQELAKNEKESYVFLHHPPIAFGNIQMDEIGCRNGAELLKLVDKYTHFTRIFCGHVHRVMFAQYKQAIIASVSGTTHQVPYSYTDKTDRYSEEAGPILMHRHMDNVGLVSYCVHLQTKSPSYLYNPQISCFK